MRPRHGRMIAQCALRNPRVQAIGASLREQPHQRRYLSFTMASQLFCGMLGLAGAHIILMMAAPADEASNKERTATVIAVTCGFSAAGFWSPVYGNMVLLLALYSSLRWIEIFPVCVVLAQITLLVGVVDNRRRQSASVAPMADSSARCAMPCRCSPPCSLLRTDPRHQRPAVDWHHPCADHAGTAFCSGHPPDDVRSGPENGTNQTASG